MLHLYRRGGVLKYHYKPLHQSDQKYREKRQVMVSNTVSRALEDGSKFGPAMRRLDTSQQAFVCILFSSPKSITKAAELAGYTAPTRNALRVQAHRLLRDPRIAEAVREESKRRTVLLLPKAQTALEYVLDNPNHQDHFKAIKTVRDDGGATKVVERVLNVNVQVSDQEKLEAIKLFAINHGIDPAKFLGFDPGKKVIDAEVEEVVLSPEDEERALGII